MGKFINKIAYIVPTKDRLNDLRNLLNSLIEQTYIPDQLVIVDGGDNTVENITREYSSLPIEYIRVYPPGLTRQRNAGMEVLRQDISLVGYLDDDLVLEKDATEKLLIFWESASSDIGGTSFNITNSKASEVRWFTHLFGINNGKQGTVLRSGYNIVLCPVIRNTEVKWLCGGATVWRRKIISEYKYDEKIRGFGHFDDIDYSLRVGRYFKLYVLSNAKVKHFPPYRSKSLIYERAKHDTINRYYIVKKNPELSVLHYYWAIFGAVLLYTTLGIIKLNKDRLFNAFGIIAGTIGILTNRTKSN